MTRPVGALRSVRTTQRALPWFSGRTPVGTGQLRLLPPGRPPDLKRFAAYNAFEPDPLPVDDDGPRAPSMCYEQIRNDLAEIVEGAARLIERRWPFETAMSDHFARIWVLRQGRAHP